MPLFLVPFWTLPVLIHFYASAETHTARNTPFCALLLSPWIILFTLGAALALGVALAGSLGVPWVFVNESGP